MLYIDLLSFFNNNSGLWGFVAILIAIISIYFVIKKQRKKKILTKPILKLETFQIIAM